MRVAIPIATLGECVQRPHSGQDSLRPLHSACKNISHAKDAEGNRDENDDENEDLPLIKLKQVNVKR